ncbi:MAG: anaerobic ribonucleoside-triphosphate reductase [Candidatus Woesearchaeota archaeon]
MTDSNPLVTTPVKETISEWSRGRITDALVKEINLSQKDAEDIAVAVEHKVLRSGVKTISTSFLRELVNNELFERGMTKKLEKQEILGLSVYNLNQIIFSKTEEQSTKSNNPEAVNLAIAQQILKNYALKEVFSKDVAQAHLKGIIHLHDLGHIIRLYNAVNNLEYIKKYGLKLSNLNTRSNPAKHARTLTGHLNTFLASMQAYYSGVLEIEYLNISYAPLVAGKDEKELKQEAQNVIFGCNQNAFIRGGEAFSIDFNIYPTIPKYLENTPAIGRAGKYLFKKKDGTIEEFSEIPKEYKNNDDELVRPEFSEKYGANGRFLTYKDFEKEAQSFARALIQVLEEGDAEKKSFTFPRINFNIQGIDLSKEQTELLKYACKVSESNGAPYFKFERPDMSRTRLSKEDATNKGMNHPESLRYFGFQNVIINLPRCAYETNTEEETITKIKKSIDLAIKANLQKKAFITKISNMQGTPLWQLEMKASDGQKYADINNANYIIGMVGLNECVKRMTGKELHETEESYKAGLRILSAMYLYIKELEKIHGLKISLEQDFQESPNSRFAKIDMQEYPESKEFLNIKSKTGEPYYTDSINISDNADISLAERIEKQGKLDMLIESRTVTKIPLGNLKHTEIYSMLIDAFKNTSVKCLKFEK